MPVPRQEHRLRRTSPQVHLWDRLAGMVISVGGVFVIVAVLGICLFLAASVVPLFKSGTLSEGESVQLASPTEFAAFTTDEYQLISLGIGPDGLAIASHLGGGEELKRTQLGAAGAATTVVSFDAATGLLAIGRNDGSVQLGKVSFESELLSQDQVSESAKGMVIGTSIVHAGEAGNSVIRRQAIDQYRRVSVTIDLRDPVMLKQGEGAVKRIDYRARGENEYLLAMRERGAASLNQVRTIRPLGGGKPRVRLSDHPVPFSQPDPEHGLPDWAFVNGDGTSVLMLWRDGIYQRYACRNPDSTPISLAENMTLVVGTKIQQATMGLGGLALLMGDDKGTLHSAFAAVEPASFSTDGLKTVVSHRLQLSDAAITAIGIGTRDRSVAVGDAAGGVHVVNITSEKNVADTKLTIAGPVKAVTVAPKFDAIVAVGDAGKGERWELDPGHPDASFKSLFGKVHYEGTTEPSFVYQSTSGEDSSEPKLSLVPLILGTVKATIFAMLFAAPLGILAAVYTSEFVRPDARKILKPSIEMMASLPSVVLGFITALIVAPWVAEHLPSIMLAFFVVPMGVMLGGYLWQLIPPATERRVPTLAKFGCIALCALAGVSISALIAPTIEKQLFGPTQRDLYVLGGSYSPVDRDSIPGWVGGRTQMEPNDERRLRNETGWYFRDGRVVMAQTPRNEAETATMQANLVGVELAKPSLRSWLDGNVGAVWPGWFVVLFPVGAVGAGLLDRTLRGRGVYAKVDLMPRKLGAVIYLGKFIASVIAAAAIAAAAAVLVASVGLDSRDFIFGSFSQRNTLVVGIMMGFAIIPIIFTISEDAMRSVPAQLRTASLGAGATPWQTALRIVVPVAGSGIFSAIMIGLGRATGETMIVVMATGNTASMDWNLFSGFRTLSANIAVELPEAAQDTTHYRVLFLCGLVLFAMTFVLNTSAEIVRQRVRRRNAAL